MEQALNERWVTVRVEDTCDGLLIHPDDAQKWGLETDHAYEGYFLPDGRYRIQIVRRTPPAPSGAGAEIEAVAWQYRTKSVQKAGVGWVWSEWKNGRAGKGYGFEAEERALVPASSLATLQAEVEFLRTAASYNRKQAEAAESQVQSLTLKLEERDKDAVRYRWLRDERGENNRWPHIYQYPYQPNIDAEKVPQFVDGLQPRNPDNLDAAIDLAFARARRTLSPSEREAGDA